ncbi:type I iodothyronine deiodinase-like [Acropora millepora]|uniref:type I iodothyronine deiodinase-like n=1 Tax=Acropora millepora TaxID=45264 RepID=UPI0010FCD528|nr:type I iodothyronine deiodinase-like [Acropora millepora]
MFAQTIQVARTATAYTMLLIVFSIGTLLKSIPAFQVWIIRAFDAVTNVKLPVCSYWDSLFSDQMFQNVWHSVALDLNRKIKRGHDAPNTPVVSLSGKNLFPLLQMTKPGRALVLNFGSCTCPIFMDQLSEFQKMAEKFSQVADFCVVYIEEAHPSDGWALKNNYVIRTHRNQTERCNAARRLAQKIPRCPVVVDTMLDTANIAYGALPIRLHVIRDGKVAYEGRSGPTGYDMKDVMRWLTTNCKTV